MKTTPSQRPALERLLAPLVPRELDDSPGSGDPEWLFADAWRLLVRPGPEKASGEVIEEFRRANGEALEARVDSDSVSVPFDLSEAYVNYVQERWRETVRPRALSEGQLGLYYKVKRFIPR